MQDWAYQWKMFNLESAKEAEGVLFWRNSHKIIHSPLYFNNTTFKLTHTQKLPGLQLNRNLAFNEHTNSKISRVRKGLEFLLNCNLFYHAEAC